MNLDNRFKPRVSNQHQNQFIQNFKYQCEKYSEMVLKTTELQFLPYSVQSLIAICKVKSKMKLVLPWYSNMLALLKYTSHNIEDW